MPFCLSAPLPQAAIAFRSGFGAAVVVAVTAAFLSSAAAQTEPSAPALSPVPAAPVAAPAAPPTLSTPSLAPTPAATLPGVAPAFGGTAATTAAEPADHAGAQPEAGSSATPMALPQGEAPEPASSLLPHDLSPWGMFMAADWVVKGVMIGLAFASVLTWTVWLGKSLELAFAKRQVSRTLKALRSASDLPAAAAVMPQGRGPAPATVRAALAEWEVSDGLPSEGIKERVSISLNRIEAAAGRRMSAGTGILATIGAIAPFVGLFGTVWGIMNSFIGISKAHTTNLAVVAPGIAEALLATAIGLVAAIPAVVIYNIFARAIAAYKARLADASAEVMRHLSRDLDRAEQRGEGRKLRAAAE